MEANMQYDLDAMKLIDHDRNLFLQEHNPLKESGDTGVWRLHDEDGSDTGITISKDVITAPSLKTAPILVIWENEKNLENTAEIREIGTLNHCIVRKGALHRLLDDDDGEGSYFEPKKVLIYWANFWIRRYKPTEDSSKSTSGQSDMAVNDDEDKSDGKESLDDPSNGRPEQSDAVLTGYMWTMYTTLESDMI